MNGGLFNINGAELVVILLVVALVVGPDRLPEYARQLAQFVRAAREQITKVRDRVDDEVHAELGDVDWKALDPRQYDPRRIVREALLDEPASASRRSVAATGSGTVRGASAAGAPGAAGARHDATLADGDPAPFDDEAT
ncbi:twin-arginine translocase TatA/TatE family subunit [Sanguibacter sp. A247]|uniref:twin-arginine translocase TatA/TatE family subunit n=1 Tax=unclassified Sanguibacter TaxID=2645534 RepID=UPI003FD82D8C